MIREEKYMSLTDMINALKAQGYELKFRREATCLYCIELNYWILPDAFSVDKYYHFENNTFADGDRILYAISAINGPKGFLVDTCFVYEDNISHEMAEKLKWNYTLSA